jgi:ACS family hexuronate transporter-like MFS transporter
MIVANDSSPSVGIGSYRWLVCALLFFATTINYIDRQILSLLKPLLDDELHWTREQFGTINGVFQFAYAVGLFFFGWFIDRFGTRIGYAVSIAAWSAAAMGHALVRSIFGFGVARVSLGLGEGGNFPSAIKAVALWFPKKERALATALFNSGANVGAILAPATVPWIAAAWGWRSAFVAAGIAGMLWLVVWIPLYNIPQRVARLTREELAHIRSDEGPVVAADAKLGFWGAMRYPQAWAFVVAKFLTDPVWWFFLIWLPDFFKATRHLDIKKSWIHLVTIYAIVTVLSIIGGWVPGYLARRGLSMSRARKTAMAVYACCVFPIFFVNLASNWGAVLLIGLAGAAHQAWSANLFTSVSDTFPQRAVASVVGLGGMFGSASGIFFPIYTGKLLDRFNAAENIAGGYRILFGICGSVYVIAFLLNHLLAPRFEQIAIRDPQPLPPAPAP